MDLQERLTQARAELEDLQKAYRRALTAQSWQTKDGESTRSVTNANISYLANLVRQKQREVDNLQDRIDGKCTGGAFRVGVRW